MVYLTAQKALDAPSDAHHAARGPQSRAAQDRARALRTAPTRAKGVPMMTKPHQIDLRSTTPRRAPRARSAVIALSLVAALSACSGFNVREELGLVGQGPDPFTVVPNRPLEMPDDMAELPEPRPGAQSRVAPTPEADAQTAVLGAPAPSSNTPSSAEAALLRNAGADNAPDSVRAELEEEALDDDWRLLDGIMGDDELEDALNPEEEAARLAQETRPVNPNLIIPQPPAE